MDEPGQVGLELLMGLVEEVVGSPLEGVGRRGCKTTLDYPPRWYTRDWNIRDWNIRDWNTRDWNTRDCTRDCTT